MNHNTVYDKPWSGRFKESTDSFVEKFTASINFDHRLYQQDILGSIAHAHMLAKVEVLSTEERDAIVTGLKTIAQDIDHGNFSWSVALEDVHMNIESALIKRIGPVGKKLHTGRSRNDQVATDIRLYLRDAIDTINSQLLHLQRSLLTLAEREATTIMPGFTHLQTAQPVTFGHHLMAWFEMLTRDAERFTDCRRRVNVSPLGAAALAGTTFPIDRAYTAELLGFNEVAENSLDAVSDRDFAIEFAAAGALLMTHLSRFSEELILWSSAQFDFITLPDRFCTGSSIMPQKKNPDVPELVRGKTGRVNGHLISLLTLMKGQPLAYNKDNQEDKEPVFDTIDTLLGCLRAFIDMIPAIKTNPTKMREAATKGYATATDFADYLVRKGVSFRDAHEIVGKAVALAIDQEKDLSALSLKTFQDLTPVIDEDVFKILTLEGSVMARNHLGGTAPTQVQEAIKRAHKKLNAIEEYQLNQPSVLLSL
ncbi:argininosuccinate lyase [Candidatus Nitrosoglobus terrae]|uniref:Argininosuccinate lyase n=1 Tax=Candidatus Nitrosoglobus terrae TaxID=1630141 RepID=A0A1Q2SPX4_9GAMM|nr:argininosuccinate lyase [Candidatus Nitrosoglobus terrae]BAW81188.1 argininosuccinate lyase [Candidatus Nitrosoglobus terrae]